MKTEELADLFKVFGDATRIKILIALQGGEKSVNELCEEVGMSQSAVSHQLNTLRMTKLVHVRREGKFTYYTLDDDHVRDIIQCGREHIEESAV